MVSRRNFLRFLSIAAQPRSAMLQAIADIPPAELPPIPTQEVPKATAILAKADEAHEALTAVFGSYYAGINPTPQLFTEDLRPQLKPLMEATRDIMALTSPLRTGNAATDSEIRKTLGELLDKRKDAYLMHAERLIDALEHSPAFKQDLADAKEIMGPNPNRRDLTTSMYDASDLQKNAVLGAISLKSTDMIAVAIGAIRETSKQWNATLPNDDALRTDLAAIDGLAKAAEKKFGLPDDALKNLLALGGSEALKDMSGGHIAELVDPKTLMQRVVKAVEKAVMHKADHRWTDDQHAQALAALQAQFREVAAEVFPNISGKDLPLPDLHKYPKPEKHAAPGGDNAALSAAAALASGAMIAGGLADKPAADPAAKDVPATPATPEGAGEPPALPAPDQTGPIVFGTHTGDVAKERVEQKKEPGQGK